MLLSDPEKYAPTDNLCGWNFQRGQKQPEAAGTDFPVYCSAAQMEALERCDPVAQLKRAIEASRDCQSVYSWFVAHNPDIDYLRALHRGLERFQMLAPPDYKIVNSVFNILSYLGDPRISRYFTGNSLWLLSPYAQSFIKEVCLGEYHDAVYRAAACFGFRREDAGVAMRKLRWLVASMVPVYGFLTEMCRRAGRGEYPFVDAESPLSRLETLVIHAVAFTEPYRADWETCPLITLVRASDAARELFSQTWNDYFLLHGSRVSVMHDMLGGLPAAYAVDFGRLLLEIHKKFYAAEDHSLNYCFQRRDISYSYISRTLMPPYKYHLYFLMLPYVYRQLLAGKDECDALDDAAMREVAKQCASGFADAYKIAAFYSDIEIFHADNAAPFPDDICGVEICRASSAWLPAFPGIESGCLRCLYVPESRRVFDLLLKKYNFPKRDALFRGDVNSEIMLAPWSNVFPDVFVSRLKSSVYCGRVNIAAEMKGAAASGFENLSAVSPDNIFHKFYMLS